MLKKTERSFSILFITLLIIEQVTAQIDHLSEFHYIAKPALLLALIIYFLKHNGHLELSTKRFTILALVFSLLGDVLLMFVNKSPNFFISGLISFLLAHIMYVIVFLKKRDTTKNAFLFIAILLIYASGLFYFLKSGLGDLLIPVGIYMIVILSMATAAYLRLKSTEVLSYNLVFVGAILFMISDSLLALNKFHIPLDFADFGIMTTYAFAQIFIVFGLIKQR